MNIIDQLYLGEVGIHREGCMHAQLFIKPENCSKFRTNI